MHLIVAKQEELLRDVKGGGHLGCNNQEVVEFRILRGSKANSGITTLDFRRASFGLVRDLLGRILWETALGSSGVQESWLFFFQELPPQISRTVYLNMQEMEGGWRPAWMNTELLTKLRFFKKEAYNMWKQGRVTQEDYRGTVQA